MWVIAPQISSNPNVVGASNATLKRRDSFSALSTVIELQEETDEDKSDLKSEAKLEATLEAALPAIPSNEPFKTDNDNDTSNQFDLTVDFISEATPSLLSEDSICEALPSLLSCDSTSLAPQSLFSHTESVQMELPEAAADVPPMLIPAKNPKLYQLVQMSGESSFWWDSTDSSDQDGALGTPPGFGHNFGASFDSYTNDNNVVLDGNTRGPVLQSLSKLVCFGGGHFFRSFE